MTSNVNAEKTVLVINCGSSSLKFAIINPDDGHVFLNGIAEKLGLSDARIEWRFEGLDKESAELGAGADHNVAVDFLNNNVLSKKKDLLDSICAVGHRIVQGGELYSEPTLVDDEVEKGIERCIPFAPLHNPGHLIGIRAARKAFNKIPHVTVFDTAFHQTMPDVAYRYAIPEELYTKHGIRRYGAHGTSHGYVYNEAARELGYDTANFNAITCHLGNGASISAVKNGKCMDTSMGLTPLDGLVMGTRTGSIDASVVFFMCDVLHYKVEEVREIFNKKSGLIALSGATSDWRDICSGYQNGDEKCALAFKMFCYRAAKFIASYYVPLGHVDAIVFTGGIGENSYVMRKQVIEYLPEILGAKLDDALNEKAIAYKGGRGPINAPDSKVKIIVVPTNEELVIARSAYKFVK
ncbi:MAG: acetate kinase [Succinimonas sp.]|nr:acetate kinase [Succinimonas sp.]